MPALTDGCRSFLAGLLVALFLASSLQPALATAKNPAPAAKEKAAERKRLERAARKDPQVVLNRSFVRNAALFGLDLPVTIRLTRALDQVRTPGPLDDAFQLDLGTQPTAAPLPAGIAPGVVSSTLDGSFIASLRFSQDPAGYGGLGIVELGFGAVKMTGTGFDLVKDSATPCTLARTNGPVTISGAPGSRGYVDLFGGAFEFSLHTQFAFSSQARATCADPFTTTSVMDGTARPPQPIRIKGTFRISPAITPDGRFRLGRMVLSGAQHDSFAKINTCTAAPPPALCPAGDPTEAVLPSRLLATSFDAELLIGATL